jgi:hypothetical protein
VFLWSGDLADAERLIERLIDQRSTALLWPLYHAVGIGQKGALLLLRGDATTASSISPAASHTIRDAAFDHDDRVRDGAR